MSSLFQDAFVWIKNVLLQLEQAISPFSIGSPLLPVSSRETLNFIPLSNKTCPFFFLQSHNNNPSEISRLFPFTLLWKQHCLWCQWAMSYDLEECCCHCVSKWWQRWRNCRDRDRPAGREKEKEAERKNNKRCFLSESDNGQVELEHLKKIYLCTKSIKSQHF